MNPPRLPDDPLRFFADAVRLSEVPTLEPDPRAEAALKGKRLGLLNGASWVVPWCNYFGRLHLPGVQLVHAANDAVQLSFMDAHKRGAPCPPQRNIEIFAQAARDLVDLASVDAVLITCSTMNRSYPVVARAVTVPVVQIDMPMMEAAVRQGGRVLVLATHGPTVESTRALLVETAERLGARVEHVGVTVERAWECLAVGDVAGHNALLRLAIDEARARDRIDCAVLAQLSMSVFVLSYPDAESEIGLPVHCSGEHGFRRVRELLSSLPH